MRELGPKGAPRIDMICRVMVLMPESKYLSNADGQEVGIDG
jgi:hypothetical protein